MLTAAARRTNASPERIAPGADRDDFSIVLGGPLFQLLRRAHLTDDALELLRRRIVSAVAILWLPLLVLAFVDGTVAGGVAVPFLYDVQMHARFLVAVPLLVVAELVVHARLRPVAHEFVVRGLVAGDTLRRFEDALRSALRLRNSIVAEVAMLAIVYGVGVPFIWREITALDVPTWYAFGSHATGLTHAGIWYAYVSVPLFQFLLMRWYFRMLVWASFLWRVSRIPLKVSAMHADRMGGLGFLANTVYAFVPLLMAHGALLSGTIANRIFFDGGKLVDSKAELAVVVGFLLVLVFVPLTVFAPQVSAAKRAAQKGYGRLAQRYVCDFEKTWLPGDMPAKASPLGTGDIQSLADLANSFETVRSTRVVPITKHAFIALAVATLVPVAPLLLTVVPAEELAKHLLKLLL